MRFNLILSISILLTGCIKKITPDLRTTDPILVVEGLLLTDSTPCKVVLSYSGIFNENGAQVANYINDAVVYLKDEDLKDSVQLINQQNGIYVSKGGFIAKVGE